ncbi:2'-5'-oligoadenylate synthase-like protein 2 [Contarinia nasturtii]|uniref:2'-5'-oligoadenylate synthase-like protein 2 n=1 Tax=Contarinia nasturtii TaxID=265458 RepID=UPI0012D39D17|nr:2'-5'-oligoadenylate synthase-like protein 2 [Contarinia nasturtii]
MDPFELNMNKAFQKLAVDIIPADKYLKDANECANNIMKLLQAKSRFDIGHVQIAGSTGKKTTIMSSDMDCVLFINGDELPPFKHVLDDFDNILTMTNSYQIRDVRTTKYSIQFKAKNFDFDILPAVNFTEGLRGDGDRLIDIQQQKVLELIRRDPKKNGYMYSSSLADAATRWMKRQDGFVNEMVRIAKFWYKTLYFTEYVSGAKSCIELVAVHAAIKEQNMDRKSYLRSFKRFIEYLRNFSNLNIHFEKNEFDVFDNSRPRVVDPVNPYNNLAKNWDWKSIQLVSAYANETDRRLQWLANVRAIRLDQLFESQPSYRPDIGEIFKSKDWLVSTINYSLLPDLKIRNEIFHKDSKLRYGLDIIKNYFQIAIITSNASSPNCDENQILTSVESTISKQIHNSEMAWKVPENENHEDYDVSFTMPVSDKRAIRISYSL